MKYQSFANINTFQADNNRYSVENEMVMFLIELFLYAVTGTADITVTSHEHHDISTCHDDIKALHYWPFVGELICDWQIPLTKDR